MINLAILQEVRKQFSSKDIPLLTQLINKMYTEKPYQGLRILYNMHITRVSLVQIEALVASGADVIVTLAKHLHNNAEAINLLQKANVKIVSHADMSGMRCDIAIDCCGELLDKVTPNYGTIELTQTGIVKYKNSNINYPVISVDDSQLKNIETLFGVGDGFIRSFRQLTRSGLHHKKFIVFGYGKVGKSIVRALLEFTKDILVIEKDQNKITEAKINGVTVYHLADDKILPHLLNAYCIISATGIKNVVSDYFKREQIAAKYLVNMGFEDEYGDKFAIAEVLNEKMPINFCLKQPVRTLFLDLILYAQNSSIPLLLNKNLPAGVHSFPNYFDLEILSGWIANHYYINPEGNYLKGIIENVPFFIYWKDCDSVYQGCNAQFARAAGFATPEEIVGKTDYELAWGQTEAELYRQGDLEAFTGKALLNFEETQQQADGNTITVLASKVPYYDEDNHIIGVLGVYADLTKQKLIEKELRETRIANDENKAKSNFIAEMSHDIRTPLAGIIGMAEILSKESDTQKINENAKLIQASAERLLELLNTILELVSADEIAVVKLETFSLKQLIMDLKKLVLPNLALSNIEFKINIETCFPEYIVSDYIKLMQILFNLISNAIQFTEQGHINLSLKQLIKTSSPEVEFIISDTGIGIAKEEINKIFDRFYRVHPSYQGKYKGHGLGLCVVKKFINLLGGDIKVESKVGKGSIFILRLPLQIGQAQDVGSAKLNFELPTISKSTSSESAILQRKTADDNERPLRKALVVEDDAVARRIVKTFLQSAGFEVDDVTDAETGFDYIINRDYDLLITDIGLPGMNGYEFATLTRSWEKATHHLPLPIVGLSAHSFDKEKESLAAGMNILLAKPANEEKIRTILEKFFLSKEEALEQKSNEQQSSLGKDLPVSETELFQMQQYPLFDEENGISNAGNLEVLKELLTILVKEMVEELIIFEKAHVIQDWKIIQKSAHKLKGGAMYCGTIRLRYACQYLERYCLTGQQKFLEQLYLQLLEVLKHTHDYLKQELLK